MAIHIALMSFNLTRTHINRAPTSDLRINNWKLVTEQRPLSIYQSISNRSNPSLRPVTRRFPHRDHTGWDSAWQLARPEISPA